MGDNDHSKPGDQHLTGEFSGMTWTDQQLDEESIEAIYETWSELVDEHETVDTMGIVFPDSCLQCDEEPPRWRHDIRKYESGRVVCRLECEHCGAEYKQEGVV